MLTAGSGASVSSSGTSVSALVVGTLSTGSVFWNSSSPPVSPPPHPGWFTYNYVMPPSGLIVGFDVGNFGMQLGEVR